MLGASCQDLQSNLISFRYRVSYQNEVPTFDFPSETGASIIGTIAVVVHKSRAFRLALCFALFAAAIIYGAAGRAMLTRLADSYQSFLGAATLFGSMAPPVALVHRRWEIARELPAARRYGVAWRGVCRASKRLPPRYLAKVSLMFTFVRPAFSGRRLDWSRQG